MAGNDPLYEHARAEQDAQAFIMKVAEDIAGEEEAWRRLVLKAHRHDVCTVHWATIPQGRDKEYLRSLFDCGFFLESIGYQAILHVGGRYLEIRASDYRRF